MIRIATEAKSASALVAAARKAPQYKTQQGDRYTARTAVRPEGSGVAWFQQDTNKLFKEGA